MTEMIVSVPGEIDAQQLAAQLVEKARAEGVDLVGPGGLLTGLTKTVLETALKAEMSEHLGCDKHDPAGRNGANSRKAPGPRPCSPRSAQSRSRCPATATGRSTR